MALDERYILDLSLEPVFVDKTTGLPLANGKIYFYEDNNRNMLKPVYQISGSPPNYTFSVLPNPITLNAAGMIEDNAENNVAIYYFPYDDFDNVDLYYIQVYASGVTPGTGLPQITREAWPNAVGSQNPLGVANSVTNMISNPQFHDVLFDTTAGLTVTYINGTTNVLIAPDWWLDITATAGGTVTVTRTAIAGTQFLPTNPPYTLNFTMGASITAIELRQRLDSNPAIWSPISGKGGYVASSCTMSTGTLISIYYRPSVPGTASQQTLLSYNNLTGSPFERRETVQLISVANTDTSTTGYVDIIVNIPLTGIHSITSVQVAPVETNEVGIAYEQASVARQKDRLFNYYQSELTYKPIPSYLIGWDFPLNPTQWGSTFVVSASGINTSNYVWDQTILFQSVDSGISAARATDGSLEITIEQDNNRIALIQYLDQAAARELLNGPLSVHIAAKKSVGASVGGTVSIYWTADAKLPDMTANTSIVATMNAVGKIVTDNGAWTEVTRGGLGDARFAITSSATANNNDYSFSGWDHAGGTGATTAAYMAIVIGFDEMDSTAAVDIQSISLCPGTIATRPAPQSEISVLADCQRFYAKSFLPETVPVTQSAVADFRWQTFVPAGSNLYDWRYPTPMHFTPTITLYNPVNNNALAYSYGAAADVAATAVGDITSVGCEIDAASAGGLVGSIIGVHVTADARLGEVNV